MTGYTYSETLGKIHFWTLFLGVNLTFFPMHFLGLAGMPRRIPDYPDAYTLWNSVASLGSIISLFGIVVFIYAVYNLFTEKKVCSANYWGVKEYFLSNYTSEINSDSVTSLEWLLSSPPAFHTYNQLPAQ